MLKPNLYIVGAPKAGTAYLYNLLKNVPEIFFPKVKELNYFNYPNIKNSTYYKGYYSKTRDEYLKHYHKKESLKYLGDGSVSYFTDENVPQRIFEFNPESKIIICIRNPIKRAFSHYLMDKRMGYADKDFFEYISDPLKFPKHYHQYINNSLYSKYIENYKKIFGNELIVLQLERIEDEVNALFEFLNLKYSNDYQHKKINQQKVSRFWVSRYFQNNRDITSKLKLIIPKKIIEKLNPYIYKKAPEVFPLNKEINLLTKLFADDIMKTQELLGRKLSY